MSERTGFIPLPVPTRVVEGEGVSTYAQRHSENNFTTVKDVEDAVREQGYPLGRAKHSPIRRALWRDLGALRDAAFEEPHSVAGNWVVDRALCERCTLPHPPARGRLSGAGMVCLKHRRWLGQEQVDLSALPEVVRAERHWRRHLRPRVVVIECPVHLLAREAASVGASKSLLAERAARVEADSMELLLYPETVKITRLLTRTSFLDSVLSEAPSRWKRAMVEREVSAILPDSPDAESWRALARIWDMVLNLQDVLRDARWLGHEPSDRWNVLRYSRLAQAQDGRVSSVDQMM